MSPLRITQVGTVGVPVRDQQRALDFWDGLGFETRIDGPFREDERWIEVAPPGAATTIALVLARDGDTAGVDTNVRFSSQDAGADHAELRERGVDADEEVMRWGGGVPPMFFFRDPDGNSFLIVER